MVRVLETAFVKEFNDLQFLINQMAHDKGFWNDYDCTLQDSLTKLMLVTSELGELAEGLRHDNPASDHIPEFSAAEEEAADAIIRLMDLCEERGWRLAEAIEAKVAFNAGRPYKHGKCG